MVSSCGIGRKVSSRSLRIERKARAAACFVGPVGAIECKSKNKRGRAIVICVAALSVR